MFPTNVITCLLAICVGSVALILITGKRKLLSKLNRSEKCKGDPGAMRPEPWMDMNTAGSSTGGTTDLEGTVRV